MMNKKASLLALLLTAGVCSFAQAALDEGGLNAMYDGRNGTSGSVVVEGQSGALETLQAFSGAKDAPSLTTQLTVLPPSTQPAMGPHKGMQRGWRFESGFDYGFSTVLTPARALFATDYWAPLGAVLGLTLLPLAVIGGAITWMLNENGYVPYW
jgi:hypothetical protein